MSAPGDAREHGWWFDLSAGALITGALPSPARTKRERAPSEGGTITGEAQARACSPQTGELRVTEQGKPPYSCKTYRIYSENF